MSEPQLTSKRFISTPIVVSTFVGMMLAVPMTLGINSLAGNASAGNDQQANAAVAGADFAKFAYAFNQGYEARAVSTSSGSTACVDVSSGAGAASAAAESSWNGSEAAATVSYGRGSAGGSWGAPAKSAPQHKAGGDRVAKLVNSYSSYTSVYNSSSVSYTNSNNVVGSHNSNSTNVKVEDSRGVLVGVGNEQSASQNLASNSFNEDSYNTETNTLINNDSFNEETNVAINSGNTVTENTAVNHVEDSYNPVTNDTTTTTTVDTTNNTTTNNNSNNSIEVEDVEIDVDLEL